jgi:ABC-type sulfate transport system permease subunit
MTSLFLFAPYLFLAQESDYEPARNAPGPVFWICYCAVIVLLIAAMWKVFSKAGQPGWAAIIPIFNVYIMCKVAGRPGWWLLLMLIPLVNIIVAIVLSIDIAKRFGKGVGFAIGMILLPFIFWPILGFGSAQYQGGPPSIPTA